MSVRLLQLSGLALNMIGTALIFVFAYPPADERRAAFYVRLARLALLLIFSGFLLQFTAAFYDVFHAPS